MSGINTSEDKVELPNEDLPRTHGRCELREKRIPVEVDATEQTSTRNAWLTRADARVSEPYDEGTARSTTEKNLNKYADRLLCQGSGFCSL